VHYVVGSLNGRHFLLKVSLYLGQRYTFLRKRFLMTLSNWQNPLVNGSGASEKALMNPVLLSCLYSLRMNASVEESVTL